MSTTFLTQCPHCQTRFRVNSQQLSTAQGAVRCGSCMQVFNARLYLEQDPEAPPAASPTPMLDALQIHDDLDIDLDSPDFEQELARLARQEAEEQAHPPFRPASGPAHRQQPAPNLPVTPEPEATSAVYAGELVARRDDDDTADWPLPASGQRREPAISTDDFAAIDDGPLRLDWQPQQRQRNHWLWLLLSLLAALGLIVQYLYYNSEQLARQPELRPWVEPACNLLGCRLQARVDTEQITSSNLVVRPHAEFANALSVDAIIYNRASFAQSFPLLQLNFLDERQQVLASRTFSPQEYLGGELAGRNSMPAQTPIRIALDVLIPDPRATRYSLAFLSPE